MFGAQTRQSFTGAPAIGRRVLEESRIAAAHEDG
jgi:hypothetical protein